MMPKVPIGTILEYDSAKDIPGGHLFYGKYLIEIVGEYIGFQTGKVLKILRNPTHLTTTIGNDHTKKVGDLMFYIPPIYIHNPNDLLKEIL